MLTALLFVQKQTTKKQTSFKKARVFTKYTINRSVRFSNFEMKYFITFHSSEIIRISTVV